MRFIDRRHLLRLVLIVLFFATVCSPALAMNCVQYVRQVSGMDVSGNGWQWWDNAAALYERGHVPKPGAIMVFDRTDSMEKGHVAIVSRILDARLITINHANWAHLRSLKGHVNTGVMVEDVSQKNDWSEVKVMDQASQTYGRSNPILGFVYNTPGAPSMVASLAHAESESSVSDIDNE